MARAKIVNFNPSAINEEEILWFVAVSGVYEKDDYKCEYNKDEQYWKITIITSSFERVDPLIAECRRALGLEWKEPVNAKAN